MFLQLALSAVGENRPRVNNVDGQPGYARAIEELKTSGALGHRCYCRPSAYLNHIIEQDHRFIKKRIAASLGFRSVVEGALRIIEGYETMHLIRRGQIRWLPKSDVMGQRRFVGPLQRLSERDQLRMMIQTCHAKLGVIFRRAEHIGPFAPSDSIRVTKA